jgi:hypothetical protein
MKNKPLVNYETFYILATSLTKEVVVRYFLSENSHVKIGMYNASGKEVKKIINETQELGEYKISIGIEGLPHGMYYIKRSTKAFKPVYNRKNRKGVTPFQTDGLREALKLITDSSKMLS